MKKHIPNIITLLNLSSGFLSVVAAFDGQLQLSAYLILLAALFDFMDGMAARLLNAKSDIGNVLDSLADMISFGAAPAFLMFNFIRMNLDPAGPVWADYLPYLAVLIPVFSALRLAKFTIDSSQSEQFIGLPTPANAIFFLSLVLVASQFVPGEWPYELVSNIYLVSAAVVLFSLLLVASVPMLSLKFSNFSWHGNEARFILILIAIVMLVVFQFAAIPLIILLYMLISLLFFRKQKGINS